MPPESILYGKFTTESDVWAFGCSPTTATATARSSRWSGEPDLPVTLFRLSALMRHCHGYCFLCENLEVQSEERKRFLIAWCPGPASCCPAPRTAPAACTPSWWSAGTSCPTGARPSQRSTPACASGRAGPGATCLQMAATSPAWPHTATSPSPAARRTAAPGQATTPAAPTSVNSSCCTSNSSSSSNTGETLRHCDNEHSRSFAPNIRALWKHAKAHRQL